MKEATKKPAGPQRPGNRVLIGSVIGLVAVAIACAVGVYAARDSAERVELDPKFQAVLQSLFEREEIRSPMTVSRRTKLWNQTSVIEFKPAENAKQAHGHKEALMLPLTIAGYAATKWAPEIDSVEIRSTNDQENLVLLSAEVGAIRRFISKQLDLQGLSDAAEFEIREWEPQGKTPEQRAEEYLERGRSFAIGKADVKNALICYEAALRESPGNVDALYSVGVMKLNLKDPAGAAMALETALRIDPNDYRSHACLALVLLSLGDSDKAAAHLKRFEELRAATNERSVFHEAAFHRAIHTYAQMKKTDRALNIARECASFYPESAQTQLLLGKLLFQQKKRRDALAVFKQIMALSPNNAWLWQDVAWHLNELKDYKNGALAARHSYTLGNRTIGVFLGLSFAYINQGRYFDAKHVLVEGMKRFPNDKDLEGNYKIAHRNIVKRRLRPKGAPTPIALSGE